MTKKLPVVSRELSFHFIIITSLLTLWTIANDLTNPMVSSFKKVAPEIANVQASLVPFAFYFGYFFMALPAALFIRKYSYKSVIVVGLLLYATGVFLFYHSATYEEYSCFLVSLWELTCGLAFSITISSLLVLSLSASDTATKRLNLEQASNLMGSLTGIIIAQVFVISALRSDDYLAEAFEAMTSDELAVIMENNFGIFSVPYIALEIVVLVIMGIIIFTKIPKNLKSQKMNLKDSFNTFLHNKRYKQGVMAHAFYEGAQIFYWTYIFQYLDYMNENLSGTDKINPTWFNVASIISFLIGRRVGTVLMKKIDSAKLLMLFGIGWFIMSAGLIFLPGMPGLLFLISISVFMAIMFPTICGIAHRDMGDEAKIGSTDLVMVIVGGALIPVLQGSILDWGGYGFGDVLVFGFIREVNFSFLMPMICLAVVACHGYNSYKPKYSA